MQVRTRNMVYGIAVLAALVGVALLARARTFGESGSRPDSSTVTVADLDHEHQALTNLLARHVERGLVDYRGLMEDRPRLQLYLRGLEELSKAAFEQLDHERKLAYLINAYNACTLDLILRHYPVASIQAIPGAWDEFRWTVAGREVTLNQIEHELIRSNFNDPRVHCALVCASLGCPALLDTAYRAGGLDEQLAEATRGFLADSTRNRLERRESTLWASMVFEWYAEDFVPRWGKTPLPGDGKHSPEERAILGFFIDHSPGLDASFLKSKKVKLMFLEYDWRLNERTADQ